MDDSRTEPRPAQKSTANRPPSAEELAASERARRNAQFVWLLMALMAAMIVVTEIPNEMISWRLARAVAAREAGDKLQAAKLLEEVLKDRPGDPEVLFYKYVADREDDKFDEAIAYLDGRIKRGRKDTDRYGNLLIERSNILAKTDRFPEALADWEELGRLHKTTGKPSRAEVLNGLAYVRGIGNFELETALEDINAAIAIGRGEVADAEKMYEKARAEKAGIFQAKETVIQTRNDFERYLDTRGVILFQQGEYAAAQVDFDEALQHSKYVAEQVRVHRDSFSARERLYKTFLTKLQSLEYTRGVICYHRSRNLRKLGRDEDAERDLKKARELLQHEPDETLF